MNRQLFEKSLQYIPGGVNSPARACKELGVPPLIVQSGQGDQIYDAQGCAYIDYCGSWGALLLGHAPASIVTAVSEQVKKGSSFGITTPIEIDFAEKLVNNHPSIEKIRFVSSGTEATMSAIRLARAYTGREGIVKFSGHYHGHADPFLVSAGSGLATLNPTSSSLGVPAASIACTHILPFNNSECVHDFFKKEGTKIACVIVEPIAANMGVVLPEPGFLETLREVTLKSGALLIFDEVITGFRVAFQGAQELYGIKSDLTCLGKIIGGGFPAAAFGGRREIMDYLAPQGQVFQAGTLSGNPIAMQAGYHTYLAFEKPGFYNHLAEKTQMLTQPIKELIQKNRLNVTLQESGSMFTLFFGSTRVSDFESCKKLDSSLFREYFLFLLSRGIYVSPSQFEANFVSSAHTDEHLLFTRETICDFLKRL